MAIWLRQSTSVTLVVGPFVSSLDGVTPGTALSIPSTIVRLKKSGAATWVSKSDATAGAHTENGEYNIVLSANDTNVLGFMRLQITVTGAMPVWQDYLVIKATAFDAVMG